jgi:hypothetical protein
MIYYFTGEFLVSPYRARGMERAERGWKLLKILASATPETRRI